MFDQACDRMQLTFYDLLNGVKSNKVLRNATMYTIPKNNLITL